MLGTLNGFFDALTFVLVIEDCLEGRSIDKAEVLNYPTRMRETYISLQGLLKTCMIAQIGCPDDQRRHPGKRTHSLQVLAVVFRGKLGDRGAAVCEQGRERVEQGLVDGEGLRNQPFTVQFGEDICI